MKTKGFTLIELLAVILIISITSLIIFPSIGNVITSSKESLYDEQKLNIEESTSKLFTDNGDLLDKYHLNIIYIDLESIKNSGYLEKGDIKDPRTREDMKGCIQVRFDEEKQKYNFDYQELTCSSYATNTSSDESGFIIYSYSTKERKFYKDEEYKDNEKTPVGLYLYNYYLNNSRLLVDGANATCDDDAICDGNTFTIVDSANYKTGGSLFDTEESYVFRGTNPNNYVKFEGNLYRIISIDKKDYSLKLVGITSDSGQWDENSGLIFSGSSLAMNKLVEADYTSNKVSNYDYKAGNIDGEEKSVTLLNSKVKEETISLKTSILSVLDYVNASATYNCQANYLSNECKNSNYLYKMFGTTNSTWTINTNGNQVWYVDTDGLLKIETSDKIKNFYKVIHLNTNTYISNLTESSSPTGTKENPFELK